MTYYPAQLHKIEAHTRRRLRSRLVDQQKSKRNLFNKLIKRGVSRRQAAKAVFSNIKRWALSNDFAVTKAYPNRWFVNEMGQVIRSDKQLAHWLIFVSGYGLREEPCTDPYGTVLWADGGHLASSDPISRQGLGAGRCAARLRPVRVSCFRLLF
jgi:hypothetical protein